MLKLVWKVRVIVMMMNVMKLMRIVQVPVNMTVIDGDVGNNTILNNVDEDVVDTLDTGKLIPGSHPFC